MKKYLLLISLIVLGTSCTKDFFVYDNIPTCVYIKDSGPLALKVFNSAIDIVVVKGGYANESPSVSIKVDESLINEYNEKYGTSYSMMPSSAYSMENCSASIDAVSKVACFPLLLDLGSLEPGLWMIPLRLSSDDSTVNTAKNHVLYYIEIK